MYHLLKDIEPREIVPGYFGRFIHSDKTTTAIWEIKAGHELPLHSHHHEQISIITEGKFEMQIGEETKVYEPGGVIVIPSHVPHSGKSITDCKIIDIFCPVREEYL